LFHVNANIYQLVYSM